jgi:hypothetical protein
MRIWTDLVSSPTDAEIVTQVYQVTGLLVTVNFALMAPAGTVTLGPTVAAAESLG